MSSPSFCSSKNGRRYTLRPADAAAIFEDHLKASLGQQSAEEAEYTANAVTTPNQNGWLAASGGRVAPDRAQFHSIPHGDSDLLGLDLPLDRGRKSPWSRNDTAE